MVISIIVICWLFRMSRWLIGCFSCTLKCLLFASSIIDTSYLLLHRFKWFLSCCIVSWLLLAILIVRLNTTASTNNIFINWSTVNRLLDFIVFLNALQVISRILLWVTNLTLSIKSHSMLTLEWCSLIAMSSWGIYSNILF